MKGVYSKVPSTDDPSIVDYNTNGWFTGEMKQSYWNATAGVIARLGCPIHFYAGVGYSQRNVAWQRADGNYANYELNEYEGLAVDLGLMLKVNRFFVNGGVVLNKADDGDYGCCVGNVGIGIFF